MKPIWLEEYVKSVTYSVILAEYEDDTSRRQAFILLDNAFEQYMRESIKSVIGKKNKNINNSFFHLLKEYSSINKLSKLEFDRVMEFHNIRNEIYHNTNYLFVSESRYYEYLSLIEKLSKHEGEQLTNEFYTELSRVKKESRRKNRKKIIDKKQSTIHLIKDIVIEKFDFRGNDYVGDFMLSSPIGISHLVTSEIQLLTQGYVKSTNDKIRLLEIIESNTENAFHSFFLNIESSEIWKCYIDSVWSKYGNGEDHYIKQIRSLTEEFGDRIQHKVAYLLPGKVRQAFVDEE